MKTSENDKTGIYRIAAIDVDDPDNAAHVLEFSSREEAMRQLNAMRNEPGCSWTAADEKCDVQAGAVI